MGYTVYPNNDYLIEKHDDKQWMERGTVFSQ